MLNDVNNCKVYDSEITQKNKVRETETNVLCSDNSSKPDRSNETVLDYMIQVCANVTNDIHDNLSQKMLTDYDYDTYDGIWSETCHVLHDEEVPYSGLRCGYNCTIKSHSHGYPEINGYDSQNGDASSRKISTRESMWLHLYEGCEEGCTHEAHNEFDKDDDYNEEEQEQEYEYDGRQLNQEERERCYWG